MKAEDGRQKQQAVSSPSSIIHPSSLILAFLLGAATVLGFAPFNLFPLPVLTLAALFLLWQRAATTLRSAASGFSYGLGLFLCGASWVYVSLHDFGAMPAPLAAIATLLFCVILASLPALAGYLCARVPVSYTVELAVAAPALWTLTEWSRGWIFTGFPWLAMGYSQVPLSPLSGYAPVLGVYGVTLLTAASAGLLAVIWQRATDRSEGERRKEEGSRSANRLALILHPSSFILLAIWLSGVGLKQIAWTEPTGEPVTISLIQGNIPQELKWREDRLRQTLETYLSLTRAATGRLIILPETALPLFLDQVPPGYLEALAAQARKNHGDILIGVPERTSDGKYYNSVVSLGASPTQVYRKSHLVPFGEFIPLRPVLGWIVSVLAIPLQDFSRGSADQQPLKVAGQRVAADICYEDAFGEEIIRQLPAATLLVNVSNVAWFGRSIAPQQHLQISQTRALETGRYMLRATNTGVTGVINPRGLVEFSAPEFATAVVTREVRGFRGATPFVRWGNYVVLALCAALLGVALATRMRNAR
jgi:apolipoprotein N-acyltransferase